MDTCAGCVVVGEDSFRDSLDIGGGGAVGGAVDIARGDRIGDGVGADDMLGLVMLLLLLLHLSNHHCKDRVVVVVVVGDVLRNRATAAVDLPVGEAGEEGLSRLPFLNGEKDNEAAADDRNDADSTLDGSDEGSVAIAIAIAIAIALAFVFVFAIVFASTSPFLIAPLLVSLTNAAVAVALALAFALAAA